MSGKPNLPVPGKIDTAIEVAIEEAIHRMFDEVVPFDAVLDSDPEPEAEPSHAVRDEATLVVMEQRARATSTPPPRDQSLDDLFDDPDIDDDRDVQRDAIDLFAEKLREQAEALGAEMEPIEADPLPAPPRSPPDGRPRLIVVADSATPIAGPTVHLADDEDDDGELEASEAHVDKLFPSRVDPEIAPARGLGSGRKRETGSGIIDMKSMARTYREVHGERGRSDSDPIPLPGVVPSVVPILIPTAPVARPFDRRMAAIVLTGGAAGLVAVTVAITLLVVGPTQRGTVTASKTADSEAAATEPEPSVVAAAAASIGGEPGARPEAEPRVSPLPQVTVTVDGAEIERERRSRSRHRDDDDSDEPAVTAAAVAELASGDAPPVAAGEPVLAEQAPAPAPSASADPVAAEQACDEVGCLVEPDRECCRAAAAARAAAAPVAGANAASDAAEFPETLTRTDIDAGLSAVRGRVETCGTKHDYRGTASLKLRITENGKVKRVSISSGPSEFRRCVAGAIKRAAFPRSQQGGTFAYPFAFR